MKRRASVLLLGLALAAALPVAGMAEGEAPFRTVWRGWVIGAPAGALPEGPAVFTTKEALHRFLTGAVLQGLVFAEPVDFDRERAVYAALRSAQRMRGTAHLAAALSFSEAGPDVVWETEPGGAAYVVTGPDAIPVTEVFLLAVEKGGAS